MCGIALIVGPDPSPMVLDSMLDAIAPRGEVRETLRAERQQLGYFEFCSADFRPHHSSTQVSCRYGRLRRVRCLQPRPRRSGRYAP
jgi:hypothetical protein